MAEAGEPSARTSLLRGAPLFEAVPSEHLAALARRAVVRPMTAGERLFAKGDDGATLLVVIAGRIRIVLPSADGREQVVRVLAAGDAFGEMALLDGRRRSADAVAETNGQLLQLHRRDMMAQMRATPELAIAVLVVLSGRLRTTSRLLETMLFHDAGARLAAILLALSRGEAGRHIDITQRALGERVGATRETVNRRLREWQDGGVLALQPGRITLLDPAALRRLAPPIEAETGGDLRIW